MEEEIPEVIPPKGFSLQQAHTFYPTPEEFKDPWVYLKSIRHELQKCGIGVIQPPKGDWDFDSFSRYIDPQKLTFTTKAQNVHQMQKRDNENVTYFRTLKTFCQKNGNPMLVYPSILDIPVDFSKLTAEMRLNGGLQQVDSGSLWLTIAQNMHLVAQSDDDSTRAQVVKELRECYMKFLHPFLEAISRGEDVKMSPLKKSNSSPLKGSLNSSGNAMNCSGPLLKNSTGNAMNCSGPPLSNSTGDGNGPVAMEIDGDSDVVISDSPSKKRKIGQTDPLWQQVTLRSFSKEGDLERKKKYQGRRSFLATGDDEDVNFGYDSGRTYTLESFKKMADRFQSLFAQCKTIEDKENMYWHIVQSGEIWVQAHYGSDLDVLSHSSGFPLNPHSNEEAHKKRALNFFKQCKKTNRIPTEYMTKIGWNCNNFAESTFLHHLHESVGGVTRPMLYVGMLFSSFCWHTEDNYLYSVNYNHFGQDKLWYGVPETHADKFEAAMRKHLPDLFRKSPNLLHLLITQFSPKILLQEGVPVFTALQKAGQWVVTCPRAYHSGFNTGFNCAESVNFALEDWLPFCRQSVSDYQFQRAAVFPYEEFVMKAAEKPDNADVAQLLKTELIYIIQREQTLQRKIYNEGIRQFISLEGDTYHSCRVCGYDCYISGVTCNKHMSHQACLNHAQQMCACDISQKRLFLRVHLLELKSTLDKLNSMLVAPN